MGCPALKPKPLLLAQHLGNLGERELHSYQGIGSAGGGSGCVSSETWLGTGAWLGGLPKPLGSDVGRSIWTRRRGDTITGFKYGMIGTTTTIVTTILLMTKMATLF